MKKLKRYLLIDGNELIKDFDSTDEAYIYFEAFKPSRYDNFRVIDTAKFLTIFNNEYYKLEVHKTAEEKIIEALLRATAYYAGDNYDNGFLAREVLKDVENMRKAGK